MNATEQIREVAGLLREAHRVLFITGAGLSAESGLPTYRGIGGLYNQGETEEGLSIEVALSGAMFLQRPDVTWKYIRQVEEACREAKHNKGHELIASLQATHEVCVLTQNVDGFHQSAGSKNVIPIHGDLHDLVCTQCGVTDRVADYSGLTFPPSCPSCLGLVRPKVVLFGEMLPTDQVAAMSREFRRRFDIVFSIGTTSVFPYIAGPVFEAAQRRTPTVEINPGRTEVTDVVRYKFAEPAVDTLSRVTAAMAA